MLRHTRLLFLLLPWLIAGCSLFKKAIIDAPPDGHYLVVQMGKQKAEQKHMYVKSEQETIKMYGLNQKQTTWEIDTTSVSRISLPEELPDNSHQTWMLKQNHLDIDLLSHPIKLRPAQSSLPAQLNAEVNAAIYIGYRSDRYLLTYKPTLFNNYKRHLHHWAYSIGMFSGLGNAFISPTTTHFLLPQEYDGIVWSNGITLLFAVDNFTCGISFATDHLLDLNRSIWVYQGKLWAGLALGLNLN
ncbi:MAG: hypothetical protein KatS3mg033_2193 [Thermonema sp.]|uniref:hypothetical protein n=1 Tax=Thermonema sp. TaxID=2231181 RepID=UPI0021DCC84F|nr:hypothetical protein [Thermonema sp.]GIV40393.1 MAG: hypothetical protein KatS3mg033_2193 [Thermonema sp.]